MKLFPFSGTDQPFPHKILLQTFHDDKGVFLWLATVIRISAGRSVSLCARRHRRPAETQTAAHRRPDRSAPARREHLAPARHRRPRLSRGRSHNSPGSHRDPSHNPGSRRDRFCNLGSRQDRPHSPGSRQDRQRWDMYPCKTGGRPIRPSRVFVAERCFPSWIFHFQGGIANE